MSPRPLKEDPKSPLVEPLTPLKAGMPRSGSWVLFGLILIFLGQILSQNLTTVFVVVTVNAKVFPVGAIRGIV